MAVMKHVAAILTVCALFSGCAAQPTVYSWYHPLGGEYLFSYDHDACVSELADSGLQPGADVDGPFFDCMLSRGYSLIDSGREMPEFEQAGITQ